MLTPLTIVLLAVIIALLAWIARMQQQARPPVSPPVPITAPTTSSPFEPLFYAAAAAVDAGMLVVDADLTVRYMNEPARDLLHIGRAASIDMGLIALMRDYRVDTLVRDTMRDGEARETIIQPPSQGRTLRLRAVALTDHESGAVIYMRDVTQLSMLERARRDMVANVSHELRTPLASVKLLVETLQSRPPAPVADRMFRQLAHEVDAVTQLVDELHELSQIESGRVALQLTPEPLPAAIMRALERIRPQAERKQLDVVYVADEDLPLVLMDANRIGQVLLNLLHNAIKFTPDTGQIEIRTRPFIIDQSGTLVHPATTVAEGIEYPTHPDGDWVLVSVRDSGVGMPAADVPRIFERFYKVDRARTRNSGGTGLGLAIAKHLVEGHSGRIWATSRESVGSTFYFTLPIV